MYVSCGPQLRQLSLAHVPIQQLGGLDGVMAMCPELEHLTVLGDRLDLSPLIQNPTLMPKLRRLSLVDSSHVWCEGFDKFTIF